MLFFLVAESLYIYNLFIITGNITLKVKTKEILTIQTLDKVNFIWLDPIFTNLA